MGGLELALEEERTKPAQASGALGALVLDGARECWNLGVAGVEALLGSSEGAQDAGAGGLDAFGVDQAAAERLREWVRPLARLWLGVDVVADTEPPSRGGLLLLCSRSAWPVATEALVVHAALAERFAAGRPTYVLWDGGMGEWPWLADMARRLGLLAASADNARQLLERGAFVIAFPEGLAARAKTYDRRYRLAPFDADQLVRAAMSSGAAIVPAALLGNEESYPLLGNPFGLPLTLQFPLAGPLGLAPLPVNWRLRLGGEVSYSHLQEPGSAADLREDVLVASDAAVDAVRERMQAMLVEMLAARRSLVYG